MRLTEEIQTVSSGLTGPVCSVQIFWNTPKTGKSPRNGPFFGPQRVVNRRTQDYGDLQTFRKLYATMLTEVYSPS